MQASVPPHSRRGGGKTTDQPSADVPLPARVYNYLLGGKDNYAVDRKAGDLLVDRVPYVKDLAWANQRFLQRVVKFMAGNGITQFVDVGPGFPVAPTTDEIARGVSPSARVLYADNDPVVVSHLRALRGDDDVKAIHADVRHPEEILGSPLTRELIDFTLPVGLMLTGVLHFLPKECDLREISAPFRRRLAPGSHLAVSHMSSTGTPAKWRNAALSCFPAGSPAYPVFRTAKQILRAFGRWPLVEPGLVGVADWRPDGLAPKAPAPVMCLAGVAIAPLSSALRGKSIKPGGCTMGR